MGVFYAFYPPSGAAGSNASVGLNGVTAPTSSTEIGAINASTGNLQPLSTDAAGNLNVNIAAGADSPLPTTDAADGTPGAVNPAKAIQVAGTDGTDLRTLSTNAAGDLNTNVLSSALPTGASTSALQTTGNTSLSNIQANQTNGTQVTTISGTVPLPTGASTAALQSNVQSAPGTPQTVALTVQGNASGVAIPISASALPLPSGAATAANQTNGSQVTSITGTVPLPTGAATAANQTNGSQLTGLVAGSANVGSITNITGTVSLPTGASTSALQTTGNTSLSTIATNTTGLATAANQTNGTQTTQINGGGNTATVTAASALKVDGSAVTQPVSGTVTVNAGTGTFAENLTQVGGAAIALNQTTSSASLPVTIASDQTAIPVTTAQMSWFATPTTTSMAAANATVAYTIGAGGSYYLTVTNAPLATTAFSGTVTFQYSVNGGSSWSSLTVTPIAGPSSQGTTTTTTAAGLYYVNTASLGVVATEQLQIRSNMTAYTSGTAYFFVASVSITGQKIIMPWTPQLTSGNTITGPIDVGGMSEMSITVSARTTTVVTAQGTNDPTVTTWNTLPVITGDSQNASAATIAAAGDFRIQLQGYKWMRLQVTTTGTVFTIVGMTAILGQQVHLSSFGDDVGVTVNNATVAVTGTITAVTTVTNTNSIYTNTDQASGAITTTTTGAAKTLAAGCVPSLNVAITAVSGTTPTYDFQIQVSIDGTNWNTIYQAPRQTTTGFFQTPQLATNGIDYRYVETIGGTTPSFTRAITSNRQNSVGLMLRNLVDRSIATTSTNSTTASLYVEGCTTYTAIVNQGSGGLAVTFAMDLSDDNSNWVQSVTQCIGVTGGTTPVTMTYSGAQYRYMRVRVVTGIASTTISYITLAASANPGDTMKSQTGVLTDNSGTTSSSASTSTQIMAANGQRRYLFIQNVGTATIWINFTTAANASQPSIELTSGQSFVQESSFVSQEAVNVLSATASVPYTAKQA